jgi:CHASE3 domain sensor protein
MEVQRLILEVAKRHNVLLGPNDPILVTLTLNELILTDYVERIDALLQAAQADTSAGTAQQLDAAREIASKLVTGVAGYVAGEVQRAGATVHAQMLETLKQETLAARQAASEAARAKRSAFMAAIIAVAAAALVAGLLLGAWIFG